MIWQPEFTDKTLSRKPGAVHFWTHSGYESSCPAGYFSPSVLAFAVPPWAADRVTLTADGRIENSGSISAKTDVHLATTRELHNSGSVYAGQDTQIQSNGVFTHTGNGG
ncbi:hypothetical protein OM311_19910 [Escherichia albertii]|nr:hypothetical protein [Escherichia albertii]